MGVSEHQQGEQELQIYSGPHTLHLEMPGFWRRPIARVYSYNLDLGETYYSPMREYLDKDTSARGETPGALTYSERMARSRRGGERDRQKRKKKEEKEKKTMREAIR